MWLDSNKLFFFCSCGRFSIFNPTWHKMMPRFNRNEVKRETNKKKWKAAWLTKFIWLESLAFYWTTTKVLQILNNPLNAGLTQTDCYCWWYCLRSLLHPLPLITTSGRNGQVKCLNSHSVLYTCISACCVITSYLASSPLRRPMFWLVCVIWGSKQEGSPICGFCTYTPLIFSRASLRSDRQTDRQRCYCWGMICF